MRPPNSPRLLVTALYFVLLNWLLLTPADTLEEIPTLFPHEDKVAHFLVFLALAWLARWSAPPAFGPKAALALAAALLFYAGGIEAVQPVLGGAGRQFDLLDMAGNLAGTSAGWLLFGAVAAPPAGAAQRPRERGA